MELEKTQDAKTLVLVEIREGYRVLTLNRPDRLNSFSESLHVALMSALLEAEADKTCRALILTGAGRGFCAGEDLSNSAYTSGTTPDLSSTLDQFYNPLVRKLRALPSKSAWAAKWRSRLTQSGPGRRRRAVARQP